MIINVLSVVQNQTQNGSISKASSSGQSFNFLEEVKKGIISTVLTMAAPVVLKELGQFLSFVGIDYDFNLWQLLKGIGWVICSLLS
jgi:hypothetical protein